MKQREIVTLRAQEGTCAKGCRQPKLASSMGGEGGTPRPPGIPRTNRQVLLSGEDKIHQVSREWGCHIQNEKSPGKLLMGREGSNEAD